jgi:hypothetical protein
MSNKPKRTVTGEYGGVYGPGGALNIGKNKTTPELLNNIPDSNLNSNEIIENNIERSRSRINARNRMNAKLNENRDIKESDTKDIYSYTKDTELDIKDKIDRDTVSKNLDIKEILKIPNSIQTVSKSISSPFKIIYILIILAILLIVTLFFFYKDIIIKFFNDLNKSNNQKKGDKESSDEDKKDEDKKDEDKKDEEPPVPKIDVEKANDPAVKQEIKNSGASTSDVTDMLKSLTGGIPNLGSTQG